MEKTENQTIPNEPTSWTVEQLETDILRISNQRDALREIALTLTAIRDKKVTAEAAKAKVAAMSDAEKDALIQAINA